MEQSLIFVFIILSQIKIEYSGAERISFLRYFRESVKNTKIASFWYVTQSAIMLALSLYKIWGLGDHELKMVPLVHPFLRGILQ
jgi:hypothetical protein